MFSRYALGSAQVDARSGNSVGALPSRNKQSYGQCNVCSVRSEKRDGTNPSSNMEPCATTSLGLGHKIQYEAYTTTPGMSVEFSLGTKSHFGTGLLLSFPRVMSSGDGDPDRTPKLSGRVTTPSTNMAMLSSETAFLNGESGRGSGGCSSLRNLVRLLIDASSWNSPTAPARLECANAMSVPLRSQSVAVTGDNVESSPGTGPFFF